MTTSNYSLIATWTYFSIYAFIFLITSIYCAIEVNNQNTQKNQNISNTTTKDTYQKKQEEDEIIDAIQIECGQQTTTIETEFKHSPNTIIQDEPITSNNNTLSYAHAS